MRVIDGRAHAAAIRADVTAEAARLRATGVTPRLAIVVPTDDEGTAWYVRNIVRAGDKVGVACTVDDISGADAATIAARLAAWSADADVHGVICQTPLPSGASLAVTAAHIAAAKDVDGANPLSLGRLAAGLDAFAPRRPRPCSRSCAGKTFRCVAPTRW
jgi:methylenetetrahydrofolate dehydrogenase (NADP+)/methenyltetrahydrofolate cyclohydrolase